MCSTYISSEHMTGDNDKCLYVCIILLIKNAHMDNWNLEIQKFKTLDF